MRLALSLRRAGFCGLLVAVAVLIAPAGASGVEESGESPLLGLPAYEVTEHSPVIRGRQDEAFNRSLASAFRAALEAALRDIPQQDRGTADYSAWRRSILSRSVEFIASYQILSHEVREGFMTVTVRARVRSDKLERAVEDSLAEQSPFLVRLLVLVDTFAMMDTTFGEDFDAGHEAASALQVALLKKGAILVPAPDDPPWGDDGGKTVENRLSLSTAAARKLGADYVIVGRLKRRTGNLLVLSADLVSVTSEKVVAATQSPVELQANVPPQEHFIVPAEEIAGTLLRRLQ